VTGQAILMHASCHSCFPFLPGIISKKQLMSTFTPKQALPRHPSLGEEIAGDVTIQIAHRLLPLLPPITPESVVHDNACGTGAITKAILSKSLSPPSTVHATDITPTVVEALKKECNDNGWTVTCEVMPAQKLSFDDETFTHSICSFGITYINQDADVVAEVHRTLLPSGAALFSIWCEPILVQAVLAAHNAIRPAATAIPPAVARGDFSVKELNALIKASTFPAEKVKWHTVEGSLVVNSLRRWLTVAWSLLGATSSGWLKEDEQNWDEAIDVMMKTVEEWHGYKSLGEGAAQLTMLADAVVLLK
jgi:SAM-dependent methyltransferase